VHDPYGARGDLTNAGFERERLWVRGRYLLISVTISGHGRFLRVANRTVSACCQAVVRQTALRPPPPILEKNAMLRDVLVRVLEVSVWAAS
jgi:hypothetical protein